MFFRYTFSPTFSCLVGIVTFPSVEAIMMVFPEADGPNSLDKSTLIVSIVPSTVISTFFIMLSSLTHVDAEPVLPVVRVQGSACSMASIACLSDATKAAGSARSCSVNRNSETSTPS